MKDRTVLAYATFTVIFVLLGGALWPITALLFACLVGAGVCLAGFALSLTKALKKDKYSLASLQEVHDRAELAEIEVPGVEEFDSVHCLCCGRVYDHRIPVCPHCHDRRR